MSFDVGRVRHLAEQMHRSEDDAGDPIPAGKLLAATGDSGLEWVDPSAGSLPWFDVTTYGAVGDDSTDDRTDINAAIADLNAAGRGVLYFPAGEYYVSDALTAVTVPCLVLGDGAGMPGEGVSQIRTDHATAILFTLSNYSIRVSGLRLFNDNGAETDGAAIATTTGFGTHNRYDHLHVDGFRDGMKLLHGGEWSMSDCYVTNPVRYGIYIQNADLPDGGDWSIVNSWIGTRDRDATAAIRMESGGGGKIANTKINCNHLADQGGGTGIKRYVDGISVSIGAGIVTVILMASNVSIENVSGDAFDIATVSTGQFAFINIDGCQVGLYTNNAGRAVKLTAAAAGGLGTNGGMSDIVIDGLVAFTDGTARAAVELTNTDNVVLGAIALSGFNARYTGSGDTNTMDGVAIDYAETGDITTIDYGDTPDAGVLNETARGDHRHGMADAAGIGPILICDTPSTPLVFADLIQNEAQDDLVYADP